MESLGNAVVHYTAVRWNQFRGEHLHELSVIPVLSEALGITLASHFGSIIYALKYVEHYKWCCTVSTGTETCKVTYFKSNFVPK